MPYIKSPGKNAEKPGSSSPSPYGLPIIEDCLTCKVREDRVFCNLSPSEVNLMKGDDLLRFLHEHGDACVRVAQQLAQNFQTATEQISLLGLSSSVSERLAKFLLSLGAREGQAGGGLRLKLTYTHEEIGQMIGISRETVTRLLADFKKNRIINLKGSTLVISNRPALEALAGP